MKSFKGYTFSVYIGALIFCMCLNLTGSVLNDIMTDYNIDLSNGGLMTFFQYIGSLAAIFVLSFVADRFKKPVILMCAFAVVAVSLFFISGFQAFTLFMTLYFIFGAAMGTADTLNSAVLADLYPNKIEIMLSLLHGVCGIGATLIPIISVFVGSRNWQGLYKGVAFVLFGVVALQLITYRRNKASVDSCYKKPSKEAEQLPSRKVMSDKNIVLAFLSTIFFALSQGGVFTWVVKYGTDVFPEAGEMLWALLLSFFWLGTTICRLSFGLIPKLDTLNSKKVIIYGQILSGVVLLIGVISGNYIVFLISVTLCGLFNGETLPKIVGLMSNWYPNNKGFCSSISFMALYIGDATAAIVMGIIGAAFSMQVMMLLPVAAGILSGIVAIPMRGKN